MIARKNTIQARQVVMYPENERSRGDVAGAVFGVVVIALTLYLGFAALQGEYGLFRLFQIEAQEKKLQTELAGLQTDRAALLNKTTRLSTETLDLDSLDEQARKVLGLGRPDEMIFR